ncbi:MULTISPECIES: type IV pilin protein [Acinetobacter]|uniref:type IV pilin protein n=1 Tax=Acinetobacter TaxID=469 RepID=UPI00209AD496|nr:MULTISPECIES: type IV pilin protein [Acinetobacter]MCO8067539.1 type IV pilin protein [Acinetobacter schindleri]
MVKQHGFTLIELMIVVAIVGILAAIAYPSYTQYVIKSNRVDAQAEMTRIASLMQRYKVINSTYIKKNGQPLILSDLNVSADYPSSTKKNYQFVLSNVTADSWVLTATPYGTQAGNGNIVLDHQGNKCWTKGLSCTATATTNWD